MSADVKWLFYASLLMLNHVRFVLYRIQESRKNCRHSPVMGLIECSFVSLVAGESEVHLHLTEEKEASLHPCK